MKEKKFNHNPNQTNETRQSHLRRTIAGASIFAIIVLHFVWQFSFFKSGTAEGERPQIERNQPQIESGQSAEIKKEVEAAKPDVIAEPAASSEPPITPEPKIAPSPVIRKKESRESRAERLRRAEKILTGV